MRSGGQCLKIPAQRRFKERISSSVDERVLASCVAGDLSEVDLDGDSGRGQVEGFIRQSQVRENGPYRMRLEGGRHNSARLPADRRVCGGFKGPPQSTHFSMSSPNTRARSSAHRLARSGRSGAACGASTGSAAITWAGDGCGTMSGRILACGAKHPKKRVR